MQPSAHSQYSPLLYKQWGLKMNLGVFASQKMASAQMHKPVSTPLWTDWAVEHGSGVSGFLPLPSSAIIRMYCTVLVPEQGRADRLLPNGPTKPYIQPYNSSSALSLQTPMPQSAGNWAPA